MSVRTVGNGFRNVRIVGKNVSGVWNIMGTENVLPTKKGIKYTPEFLIFGCDEQECTIFVHKLISVVKSKEIISCSIHRRADGTYFYTVYGKRVELLH